MLRRALVFGCALWWAACGSPGESDRAETPPGEGAGTSAVTARPDPGGASRSADDPRRSASGSAGSPDRAPARSIGGPAVLFFGTSLTAGYGLEDPDSAFPARIRGKLDSVGLPYRVVDAGVPGETSAAGVRRIGWTLEGLDLAALVLELGANDGLRGLGPDAMEENLQAVVDSVRARHPDASIVVAGMEAPPNLGARYTDRFRTVFREVARRNGAALVPFLLDGVAGDPSMNQPDGIHPTARGHAVVAENLWPVLDSVLRAPTGDDEPRAGDGSGG